MELVQTTLSRRDSQKIARRFNAGNGSPCASSPVGARASARFNVHSPETQEMSASPSIRTLKRRERRAPSQPSLRDLNRFASQPGVKTPGYGHSLLRDKTAGATFVGARLWSQTQPQRMASTERVVNFVSAAADAAHTAALRRQAGESKFGEKTRYQNQ